MTSFEVRFAAALDDPQLVPYEGPSLLPVRLAKACRAVLPVVGVGLSAFTRDGFRFPLGASDDTAATAERLQFTVGSGPSLDTHARGVPVTAPTPELLRTCWPEFWTLVKDLSSYRSVVAAPLDGPLRTMATLNLWFDVEDGAATLAPDELSGVVAAVTDRLLAEGLFDEDLADGWTRSASTAARRQVLIAMGLTNNGLGVTSEDAFALLRASAYAAGRTVDDLAADIVARRIPVDSLARES